MALECKSGCGKCCEVGGTGMALPVSLWEAEAVAASLGMSVVNTREVPAAEFTQHTVRASPCPAYDSEARACKAYEARPQVCRDFDCNREHHFTHTEVSLEKMVALAQRKVLVADLRDYIPESIENILDRHERIAFQFSGGKDSTAALFLMEPFWSRMTVYFCDSGDSMPETMEVIDKVKALVPHFVTVAGRVHESRSFFGWPTDILPWTSAIAAHANNAGDTPVMQDRVSCCFRSVMEPMHERMIEDGVTLIIRGQKNSDKFKGRLHSGDVVDGFEFLYPIQDWTDEACFASMRAHGIEPQRFYAEGLTHSGDCLQCTAWNEDNRAAYLKQHYPESYELYANNIRLIASALETPLTNFRKELENCHANH